MHQAAQLDEEVTDYKPKDTSVDTSYGWTDDEFKAWIGAELVSSDPELAAAYPETFQAAPRCITNWRRRYRGDQAIWKRIFKRDRVVKEFLEAVPVIDAVVRLIENSPADETNFTIVDLASGKGYLSMLLSELLPPQKILKFILVDKAWPMCMSTAPQPHHMNWEHIYGNRTNGEGGTYFTTWPIPLHTSKQDLKQRSTRKAMKKRIFDAAPGPVLMLGIHLCGLLSMRAVDMFNQNDDSIQFLALKPCCLPTMIHANRDEIFTLGDHSFDSKLVCGSGRFVGKQWYGPPRWHLEGRFHAWADNLLLGMDGAEKKIQTKVVVQRDGGYQNTFLFAERAPLTPSVWRRLEETETTLEAPASLQQHDATTDETTSFTLEKEVSSTRNAPESLQQQDVTTDEPAPEEPQPTTAALPHEETDSFTMHPIGTIRSIYRLCVGTPRQGLLAPQARGRIELTVDNALDMVDGLEQYSHIWIVFIFHLNTPSKKKITKIAPPALGDGQKVGVLATRSPHRASRIGMTLAQLDRVQVIGKDKAKQQKQRVVLHISGLDLVDGTPVLDLKPYVPTYDSIPNPDALQVPSWVSGGLATKRPVQISTAAQQELQDILEENPTALEFYGPHCGDASVATTGQVLTTAIEQVLAVDVRSEWQTKKARQGNSQADRAARVKNVLTPPASNSTTVSRSQLLCTQQLDNLLIHYSVDAPSSSNRAASQGSGAEDVVTVHSIQLLLTASS